MAHSTRWLYGGRTIRLLLIALCLLALAMPVAAQGGVKKVAALQQMAALRDEIVQVKTDLFNKLAVAQAQRAAGDKGRSLSQVMKDLRKRIREAA